MSSQPKLIPSSRRHPCPICGRTADGDCRISEQLVLCHYGSSKHPPLHLKRGDVIDGDDGQEWAFTGDNADGRTATFTPHKPRSLPHRPQPPAKQPQPLQLAKLPKPAKEPPAHLPHGQRITYSPTQWVMVHRDASGNKHHKPWHTDSDGREVNRAGSEPWPLWREADAMEYGPGLYVAEAEGEKCAAWFRAARLVAVSQPGHDHKPASIERRYRRLLEVDVAGVVYLADNDKTGRDKATRCAAAAAAVGLELVVVQAADVWPGLPDGGSIDDAPGTANERADALLAAIPDALERHYKEVSEGRHERSKRKGFTPRPDSQARWGKRELSHTRRMACFDRCVVVLAAKERNSLRRRARLLTIAKALNLANCVNRQDISQRVLEAKDQQQGNSYQSLTAADRLAMEWPEVEWLIPDLLPANDLSIIGGRPKVGKTAMAMAIAAAVLKTQPVAGFMAPQNSRPVIVVSDDQGDADTKAAMEQLQIFRDPALLWSRRFRLTESDLDQLLADVRRNPGAMVIIDSLRSVSRALQQGENDPEIGAVIYDLKAAVTDAGGSLLLVHHCNKSVGLTGVEALSGHNAIAGAANTVITLHYVEDGKGQPQKEADQRRLVREGRTGKPLDWVISRTAGTASFHQVGTYAQWLEQVEEASKQAKREARQTSTQGDVMEVLAEATGRWLTCREVVEALGLDWERGNGKDANRVRDALRRLADDGEIKRVRNGNQYTFSAGGEVDQPLHGTQVVSTTQTTSAPLQGSGSERRGQTSATSAPGTTNGFAEIAEIGPLHRNPLQHNAAEVVETAEALTPGKTVELMQPDGGWCNGWTVVDTVTTNIGTRVRILGPNGESLNVAADQVRVCQ